MKTKLTNFFDALRTSFWFVPALMAVLAVLFSMVTLSFDHAADFQDAKAGRWVYAGGPEGARMLLSTIAGSMITVAGVTFSITIVALALTSSQFGPRLLRNFMRDTGNQITLGTFIGTFVYCLLVLRAVRGNSQDMFVPHISVTFALLFTLGSLGILIYFIHHVASSIQANNVIAGVCDEMDDAIARLFPQKLGSQANDTEPEDDMPEDFDQEAVPVAAENSGYLHTIESEGLLKLAAENDVLVRVQCRPGEFVSRGNPIIKVWPGERVDKKLAKDLNAAFVLSAQGSPLQDVEFGIHQLVEIAVRALSPGINDPFTATTCIDRLAVALSQIAERDRPSSKQRDADGKLRLILKGITFSGIVDAAFNQIRQYGRSSPEISAKGARVCARGSPALF